MGAVLGKDLKLKWDGTLVSCLTNNGLSAQRSDITTTCKDSADSETSVPNKKSHEFTVEGIADWSSTNGLEALWTAFETGDIAACSMSDYVTGTPLWTAATAYISSFNIDAPDDGVVTWQATIKVNGEVAMTANP